MDYGYQKRQTVTEIGFEAEADSREKMFTAAADALMNIMIDNVDTVRAKVPIVFRLEEESISMLLFQFLQELVYHKDAERLLLRVPLVKIDRKNKRFRLQAEARGEEIDPARHLLLNDIKAMTFNGLEVQSHAGKWKARAFADI